MELLGRSDIKVSEEKVTEATEPVIEWCLFSIRSGE